MHLDTSDPQEVKKFVSDLGAAITKDLAEIRETELDRSGSFRKASLEFENSDFDSEECDVFVDRLGRLVTPNDGPWSLLKIVAFKDEVGKRTVLKKEPRYENDQVVALVMYLEAVA